MQLSDLHGKVFGNDNSTLISKIEGSKPNIIVITGDLVDSSFYDGPQIKSLLARLSQIAAVYYVTGNQEINSPHLMKNLQSTFQACNVHYLKNSAEVISRNGQSIFLAGIDDPIYADMDANSLNGRTLSAEIDAVLKDPAQQSFKILLTHRPEQFALYAKFNFDLIFSGHAHGGQIRLPFIGGLFAPNQGYFPKYTGGEYIKGRSTMIVNRGLGNGSFPQRLFNQPEIIVTKLTKDSMMYKKQTKCTYNRIQ